LFFLSLQTKRFVKTDDGDFAAAARSDDQASSPTGLRRRRLLHTKCKTPYPSPGFLKWKELFTTRQARSSPIERAPGQGIFKVIIEMAALAD
jgi:hypothetical protein